MNGEKIKVDYKVLQSGQTGKGSNAYRASP